MGSLSDRCDTCILLFIYNKLVLRLQSALTVSITTLPVFENLRNQLFPASRINPQCLTSPQKLRHCLDSCVPKVPVIHSAFKAF